jgi:hypothetical protein
MVFVLLGAVALKDIDMTFGLPAIIFVVTKVIFLCLIVCLFFLLNVESGLLINNTSNFSDITGLIDLISYNYL